MKRRVGFWAVGVLSISLLCGILLGGGVAHAQSGGGGVGSGGTGSGGSGGAQTQYGWGWRIYPVGAATTGPTGGFRDGSTWNQVGGPNRSCTGYSTGVAMFTINNNDSPKKQVVYSFTDNGPPNPFYGQSVTNSPAPPHYTGLYDRDQGGPMTYLAYIYRGGSYISVKQALVAYNALPASIKVGHTFGTNVGWFCYGILPQDAAPTNTFSVSCTTLTGYATDADRPNNALSVEIYMDGTAAGNRIATVTTSTSSNPRGLYTLNITNRVLLASHNFYTIVRGLTPTGGNGADTTRGPVARGPCNAAACSSQTFSANRMIVGAPYSFTVSANVGAWGSPPYTLGSVPALTVSLYDPAGTLLSSQPYSWNRVGATTLTSVPITLTPQTAGRYQMEYRFVGGGLDTGVCRAPGGVRFTNPAAYAPYFTTTGGDILSSDTSANAIRSWNLDAVGGSYAGAGGQLAALANGQINSFVTGTGLSAFGTGKGLGFANTPASGMYGGGYSVPTFTPVAPPGAGALPTGALGSLASGVYTSAGNVTLTGSVAAGKNITIVLTAGSVYIPSDIIYASYGTLSDIPRLTVIVQNGNVYVGNTVSEIHGTFYAGGSGANGNFYSCSTGIGLQVNLATGDNYSTCNHKLTVYGAVSASKLVLSRTFGNLIAVPGVLAEPAETFVYSPELWLSPATSTTGAGNLKFDSYINLPPVL